MPTPLKRPAGQTGGVQKKPAIADYASALQERLSQIDEDDSEAMREVDEDLEQPIAKQQRHSIVKRKPRPSLGFPTGQIMNEPTSINSVKFLGSFFFELQFWSFLVSKIGMGIIMLQF